MKTTRSTLYLRVLFSAATAFFLLAPFFGCESLNNDPNNTRYWFPTLMGPSEAERAARAKTFPDGGDPYVDSNVGPKSISARPYGWDAPRAKTYDGGLDSE